MPNLWQFIFIILGAALYFYGSSRLKKIQKEREERALEEEQETQTAELESKN